MRFANGTCRRDAVTASSLGHQHAQLTAQVTTDTARASFSPLPYTRPLFDRSLAVCSCCP
jgi:hypothetical protein